MKEIKYYKGSYEYVVTFSEEELKELREEIINDASSFMHVEYNGTSNDSPYLRNQALESATIKNYMREDIKIDKNTNEENNNIYHYSYDRYTYPYIEKLIRNLLNNDISVLYDIYNPDLQKENVSIYHQINYLERKLSHTDSRNTSDKLKLLKEIEELVKKAINTKEEVLILKYYDRLQNMINIEKEPVLNITLSK